LLRLSPIPRNDGSAHGFASMGFNGGEFLLLSMPTALQIGSLSS
jgi:hypothetical protein